MLMRALVAILLTACGVDYATTDPRLHEIQPHSGNRLAIEWWETSDGALAVRGLYDRMLASECAIRATDGTYYCVPAEATGSLDRYARLTHDVQDANAPIVPTSFCSDDGLVIADGFHDSSQGVDCRPAQIPGSDRYACGDVELGLEFARETTRLLPGVYTFPEGLRQHAPVFYDKQLGAACQFTPVGVGALCMPAGAADPGELVAAYPTLD
jgi:hypothetical protein